MRKTRNVTYGAMIVGIMSLALFLDRATAGTLSPFLVVPIAIPLVVYGVMFGFKPSVAVYFVSIIVSFLFSGMLPSMLMVVGYGGIALIYIYSYEKKLKPNIKHLLMFLGMVVFYAVMIFFFDEYFGLSIVEVVEEISRIVPDFASSLIYFIAYLSTALTIIMEIIIINVLSSFMITRLRLNVENKR